ncbi:hypothetical protein [Mycobacterium sp. AT1]|uniref:hypothetical protein n=1 Tax=Mycobacterium sp. AT1 TaxID=1961706 RepID=UPI0009ADB084|nr:hypothetical protein [Mycobacterium sp. AT1]OPX12976.1 hypothetical protein B1790_02000 [Mycobacterium sp. AT1]
MKVWSKGSAAFQVKDRAAAEAGSLDHGSVALAGKSVYWFRYVSQRGLPPPDDDSRTTSEILRDAVEWSGWGGPNRDELLKSIQGIISGKLSTPRVTSPEAIYATLVHITEADARIPSDVRATEDFDLFLSRKARARSAKLLS